MTAKAARSRTRGSKSRSSRFGDLSRPGPLAAMLDLDVLMPRRQAVHRPGGRLIDSLVRNIQATGLYPPLIVHPHPRRRRRFQIIDGHARLQALRRLGRQQARCEIWPVDEAAADLLAATLNRLRGQNDARDSAKIIKRIIRRLGTDRAAGLLALTPRGLRQQLAMATPPPAPARPEEVLPLHPVTFHLTGDQRARLEAALAVGVSKEASASRSTPCLPAGLEPPGSRSPRRNNTRSEALLALVEGNAS